MTLRTPTMALRFPTRVLKFLTTTLRFPTITLRFQPYDLRIPTMTLRTPTMALRIPTMALRQVFLYPPKPAPSIAPSPKTPFQNKNPKTNPTHPQIPQSNPLSPPNLYTCTPNPPLIMFFILSKILAFLIMPLVWVIALMVYAILSRNSKRKRRTFITALILLIFFSNTFILDNVMRLWEIPTVRERYASALGELIKEY